MYLPVADIEIFSHCPNPGPSALFQQKLVTFVFFSHVIPKSRETQIAPPFCVKATIDPSEDVVTSDQLPPVTPASLKLHVAPKSSENRTPF